MKDLFIKVIIVFLTFMTFSVNAEELFKKEFVTSSDEAMTIRPLEINIADFLKDIELPGLSFFENSDIVSHPGSITNFVGSTTSVPVPFNNGYLKIDVAKNSTILTYIDAYGNVLKTNEIKRECIITGGVLSYLHELTIEYDGKLYCLTIDPVTHKVSTLVINQDLEIEKKLTNKMMFGIIDDKFYFLADDGAYISNKQLEEFQFYDILGLIPKAPLTDASIDALGLEIKYLLQLFPEYKWVLDYCYDDVVEIIKIYVKMLNNEDGTGNDVLLDKIFTKLENNKFLKFVLNDNVLDISGKYLLVQDEETENFKVLDTKGNIVFDKMLSLVRENEYMYSAKLVQDYIVTFTLNNELMNTRMDIYDLKGNKIQSFSNEKYHFYWVLNENRGGFAVSSIVMNEDMLNSNGTFANYVENSNLTRNGRDVLVNSGSQYISEVYSLPQDVVLNLKGTGNITVANRARFGERVNLNVEVPEGQMLKMIRVYDVNNKMIEVLDGGFIMPNSPVTISAEFVPILKENPKTGLKKFSLIILLLIAVSLCFKKYRNKLTKFSQI